MPGNGEYDNVKKLMNTNMHVVNCSTSANYFHLLRSHMRMPFRKPLIVVSPKKLLKLRQASSSIEEFGADTKFQPLIADQNPNLIDPKMVRKVVLCSGQVYYDLANAVTKQDKNDIAILRVESLCPFPFKEIAAELKKYSNAKVTWAQEEPKNAGPWSYVEPRLRNIRKLVGQSENVDYAGRPTSASTATGYTKVHVAQLEQLLLDAMA